VHVLGDDHLVDVAHHRFLLDEEARDYARHTSAVIACGAGHLAHEAEAAAAVDQADVVACHRRAQRARRFSVCRIESQTRTAIDADIARSPTGLASVQTFLAHSNFRFFSVKWPRGGVIYGYRSTHMTAQLTSRASVNCGAR